MLKEEKMTLIEAKKKVEDQLNASTENLNNVTKVTARMTQQVEELQAELSQIAAKAAEKSRKLCETEAELERVTSANKHLLEEVIDLKDTKKCVEEKLEHSVKNVNWFNTVNIVCNSFVHLRGNAWSVPVCCHLH